MGVYEGENEAGINLSRRAGGRPPQKNNVKRCMDMQVSDIQRILGERERERESKEIREQRTGIIGSFGGGVRHGLSA